MPQRKHILKDLSRLRRGLNYALALAAFSAVTAPFARELFLPESMEHEIGPIPGASTIIAAKLVTAMLVFSFMLFLNVRGAQGNVQRRLAALSPLHAAFLAGSVVAIGLGSFDLCSAYHAAGSEAGGVCCCWLTGALAGTAALLMGLTCLTGRTILELTREVLRILIALFVMLDRITCVSATRRYDDIRVRLLSDFPLARHIAERAPPHFS